MKAIVLFLAALIGVSVHAADVTLAWEPNAETNVTHYTAYMRAGGQLSATTPITGTSVRLEDIPTGTLLEFFVTASNAQGESEPSESVFYTVPKPGPPPAPIIVSSSWERSFSGQNGLWQFRLSWLAVTNATGYVVLSEQFSQNGGASAFRTNFTTLTNFSTLVPSGFYKVTVLASNAFGLSPATSSMFSPSTPGKPAGLRIVP